MITFILVCLLVYVMVLSLMLLIGFCSYVNQMFIESCEDIKNCFKK